MRKTDFNRLVKQLRKDGCWDPVGAAKALVQFVEKAKNKKKKGA